MANQGKHGVISILLVLAVLASAYWLFSQGYIRIGRPTRDGEDARTLTAASLQGQEQVGTKAPQSPKQRKILYWQDPMHPAYKSDKPGTAPDCGMTLVPVYEDEGTKRPQQAVPEGAVKIDPAKQQLIGVQYGGVQFGPVQRTIRAVGHLAFDETKIVRIHTKISGWIDQVFVDYTGQLVKKGQPMFTVYSPDLVSTQEEFLIGLKAKHYLGDSQFKDVSTGAQSLYEAARRRLQLWDISDEQIQALEKTQKPLRDLTLYAPFDGFVTQRNAFPKQQVNPDTEVYELADLSTIWVMANIYEYELPEVKLGQTARVSLTYFPGEALVGKVSYIYPDVDDATRTAKVRIDLPNPDFKLKPDMYANVELQINYGKQLSVPEEAVMDSGTEQIVFVALGDGYFEPRKVQLGAKVDNRYIILAGLKPDEKVVTSGNFLIDSESRLKSAMGAMAGMPGMEQPKQGKPSKEMPGMPGMEGKKTSDTRPKTQDPRHKTDDRGQPQRGKRKLESSDPHTGMDHATHGKMDSPHLP